MSISECAEQDQTLRLAIELVRSQVSLSPHTAIILGSGLGGIADKIEQPTVFDFGDLPGFATSTAGGHRGQLIVGLLNEQPVIAMAGRYHGYEGHTRATMTFPVRLMSALGVQTLIISNAAGGLNQRYRVGDLVVIDSHIDWLRGGTAHVNASMPAMSVGLSPLRHPSIYDGELQDLAVSIGQQSQFAVHVGTYLATLGPNYETRAEYRMMRLIGADLAGMSTVPEAIVGARLGMAVLAISMVSNIANPDKPEVANHAEVLRAGEAAAAKLEAIVRAVVIRKKDVL